MIYFDNGATSYPKPASVVRAVQNSFYDFCANPGRGGYPASLRAAEMIYGARENIGKLFNAELQNVVFTSGCTYSLNSAIKGILKPNSHFVISDLEHNSVVRPLEKLKLQGKCEYSVAEVTRNDSETVRNFVNEFRENTIAVICTLSSNVFGIMPPVKLLAKAAHENGLLFILDAAQGAGYLPINVKEDEIDILCCAGHKGLYGPMGTGFMIISDKLSTETLIEGGTGSNSESLLQPDTVPERLESGTPNVHGIAGLSAGVNFVRKTGTCNILSYEEKIINEISENLKKMPNVILYARDFNTSPVLSFNVKSIHSEKTAALLAEKGICVRGGLHCAALAHKKFGTSETGTVRITPSWFTSEKDIDFLLNSIKKIAK